MAQKRRSMQTLLILLFCCSGVVPVILYWHFIGRVPTISAQNAMDILGKDKTSSLLIDVRDVDAFELEHLEAAENWPYRDIMALRSENMIPDQFKNKTLFLICESGIWSALAAEKLRRYSTEDLYSIRGGLQEWIDTPDGACPLNLCRFRTETGETKPFSFRESSLFEQWMACIAAFGIKPLYMLMSFILAGIVRRLKSPDMVALKWAFIWFFVGEAFCATNYIFFKENSYLVEYLHSFGMVMAFGFTTYALLEGLDLRLVRYSGPEEKCAALGLCGSCIKYADVPCGFRRMFQWLIASFIILSFMPLLASFHAGSYNTTILGTIYNYSHPVIFQIFETRYAPVAALFFFILALGTMRLKKTDPVPLAKVFFSAGMGFFGFSMFRLILFAAYRDNLVWFVFWEEATELLYIGFAGIVLWIFKDRLFTEKVP